MSRCRKPVSCTFCRPASSGLRIARSPPAAAGPRLDPAFQGAAAQQFHDDVGGAVGFEEVEHLHDRRRLVQVGQCAAFLDEAAAAPAEIVGHLGRARQHRVAVRADGQRRRQVFLDGDVAAELRVARKIGDAESALAQHARNLVAADQRARRQRHVVHLCRGGDGRRGGGGHMMEVSHRATRPPRPALQPSRCRHPGFCHEGLRPRQGTVACRNADRSGMAARRGRRRCTGCDLRPVDLWA